MLVDRCSLCGCPAGKGCKDEQCAGWMQLETPPASKSHPWHHQVLKATSQDGENWIIDENVLLDKASVPEILQSQMGAINFSIAVRAESQAQFQMMGLAGALKAG
ncbi:hypothetical protein HZB88_04260 [archaeon]|nr:hypothetical protein [archaeon]